MLTFLKIPFDNRNDFWYHNEAELEYIYNDFRRESKKIKCRLHPDNGGDLESFVRFNRFCSMTSSAFRQHGIGFISPLDRLQAREDAISRSRAKAYFKHCHSATN